MITAICLTILVEVILWCFVKLRSLDYWNESVASSHEQATRRSRQYGSKSSKRDLSELRP
jgi:hypothetical protein